MIKRNILVCVVSDTPVLISHFCSFLLIHTHTCSDNQAGVRIEWLLDGTSIHTVIGSSLLLSISSVELSDAGTYTCKAILSDGTVLGPVNAGRLSVFGKCMTYRTTQGLVQKFFLVGGYWY